MPQYISVLTRLPEHNSSEDSFGVKVLIRPVIDGDCHAFYGRRVGPAGFYRYGAALSGVTSWCLSPDLRVGSLWSVCDPRHPRTVRILADGRALAPGHATDSARAGRITIVTVDAGGNPAGRVSYAMPERFEGRAGGYKPVQSDGNPSNMPAAADRTEHV